MGPDERASILPAGTVTFLLTEAEPPAEGPGSVAPAPGPDPALSELIEETVAAHRGLRPEDDRAPGLPDGVQVPDGRTVAVFGSAADAVAAALDIQRALRSGEGAGGDRSRPPVRIGVHTGEALLRDSRYYTGPALHRCARLRDVAHGGQTLLSSVTASLVAESLPAGTSLTDLGSHRLRDLSRPERVWELRHDGLDASFPPLRSLDVLANNLPIQLTSFVGRGDELAEVELLLTAERLVTLTGSGGCGKTRLAVQAAAELADRWPDGVWWVDLGPVTDPALVAELVASTIGVLVEPTGGPLRALTLQLRDRRLLVCLDNCEHLLDASAELAETLLRACPDVSVLATSREPLDVAGETVWRVPSLADDEAVSLFVERASRVRPWFTLDATNEAAVRTLCRRLDGIPLAVELAAAWLRTLTPAQIAAGLDDRFALLVRGPRGAVARQQTLAASMEWSHDLLDEIDRVVFRRLAVFAAGFDLDAARAVCAGGPGDAGGVVAPAEVLAALGRLVDKSLVAVEEPEDGGEARYRLLETIRQYAGDRLRAAGEDAAARDRHLEHYLAFAETSEPNVLGPDQDLWLGRQEVEHDNLRAALEWAFSDGPAPGGALTERATRGRRLASALVWLWYLHGHADEGRDAVQRAIDLAPDDRSVVQARLLTAGAAVAVAGGQFLQMADYAQRGLEVSAASGDQADQARCYLLLATLQFYLDPDVSQQLCEEGQRIADVADQTFAADAIRVMSGTILATRDRHEEARAVLEDAFERCTRHGNRAFASLALNYLDDAAWLTGDVRQAEQVATQALEIARPLGDYYSVGNATCHLAFVKGVAGDLDAGWRLMKPLVRSVEGSEQSVYIPRMAPSLGMLCLWGGDAEGAAEWFAREVPAEGPLAESLLAARSLPGRGAALRLLGQVDEARATLDRAVALTERLDVPHLLAEALEQLAWLAADTGQPEQAEDLHHRALAVRVERGLRTLYVDSLDGLAHLAVRSESGAEAVRLLAASTVAREAMGYPRRPRDLADHEAALAELRTALGVEGFEAAWSEGTALSLDEAVAYARRARGTRSRPSTGWASLTPTEIDVARLVAEGLTNPEIGSRLFISRATVKTHLSHIFAKLGIANRAELAALVTTHLGEG